MVTSLSYPCGIAVRAIHFDPTLCRVKIKVTAEEPVEADLAQSQNSAAEGSEPRRWLSAFISVFGFF